MDVRALTRQHASLPGKGNRIYFAPLLKSQREERERNIKLKDEVWASLPRLESIKQWPAKMGRLR